MTKTEAIETYFEQAGEEGKTQLRELRRTILAVSNHITERMAWGLPTFYYKDKYLVQIGRVKNGIAFYSSPETKAAFTKELSAYKQTSKNALHFSLTDPLPLSLIAAMTKERIREKEGQSE